MFRSVDVNFGTFCIIKYGHQLLKPLLLTWLLHNYSVYRHLRVTERHNFFMCPTWNNRFSTNKNYDIVWKLLM
jgi:hypothetical protein